jgi:hypothetical protein
MERAERSDHSRRFANLEIHHTGVISLCKNPNRPMHCRYEQIQFSIGGIERCSNSMRRSLAYRMPVIQTPLRVALEKKLNRFRCIVAGSCSICDMNGTFRVMTLCLTRIHRRTLSQWKAWYTSRSFWRVRAIKIGNASLLPRVFKQTSTTWSSGVIAKMYEGGTGICGTRNDGAFRSVSLYRNSGARTKSRHENTSSNSGKQ